MYYTATHLPPTANISSLSWFQLSSTSTLHLLMQHLSHTALFFKYHFLGCAAFFSFQQMLTKDSLVPALFRLTSERCSFYSPPCKKTLRCSRPLLCPAHARRDSAGQPGGRRNTLVLTPTHHKKTKTKQKTMQFLLCSANRPLNQQHIPWVCCRQMERADSVIDMMHVKRSQLKASVQRKGT